MRNALILFLLSLVWTAVILITGHQTGWVTVTAQSGWMADPATTAYRHLRTSLIPFGLLLVLYVFLVLRIRAALADPKAPLSRLSYMDRVLNTVIASFFGVGVIWTAVGMETALMSALSQVGQTEDRAAVTAWGLLDRLVNGGLLLALSTTVFGGACGYVLRLLKICFIGPEWDRKWLSSEAETNANQAAIS